MYVHGKCTFKLSAIVKKLKDELIRHFFRIRAHEKRQIVLREFAVDVH